MRVQSICRCSVVNASVSLTRAKLKALQMPQRKASLSNQKQRLCRNWAQQTARATLINRLAPACVTKQETGSLYNIPLSGSCGRIVSLLLPINSQTLPKARTQQSPQQREEAKLCLLSKQVFWSYHTTVLVARRKPVKFFFFFFMCSQHIHADALRTALFSTRKQLHANSERLSSIVCCKDVCTT